MSRFSRLKLCCGLVVLFLSGCIVVDDFGEYWNKGFIDSCVNEIIVNQQDSDAPNKKAKSMLLRSLRLGNHTFVMMKESVDMKGGNLLYYKIEDGEYISYRLNESKREDFARDYPNSGVVLTSETATVPVLNKDSAKLVSTIADDDSYWVESHREAYNPRRRSDCIQTLY